MNIKNYHRSQAKNRGAQGVVGGDVAEPHGSGSEGCGGMNWYNDSDSSVIAWTKELMNAGLIDEGDIDPRPIQDIAPWELKPYGQCHFFSGISGWPYALGLAGWPSDWPVWTGSCPCQPLSSAGKQRGADDERHLWPVWYELIKECRPPVIFGEQVASKLGREWLSGVRADLEALGYAFGAADLCAAGLGAPHIRSRIYWVADSNDPGRQPGHGEESSEGGEVRVRPGTLSGNSVAACGVVHPASDGARYGATAEQGSNRQNDGISGQADPWSDFDLIACGDGKSRRVESGTSPLVARLSDTVVPSGDPSESYSKETAEGRLMRLRGYGNSIVPQVAVAFIRAFMDWRLEPKC